MLRLKKSQMAAYDEVALEQFVDETLAHVEAHFPDHLRTFGRPRVREAVAFDVGQARAHGLTTERSMCLYVTLAMMLGSTFDRDLHVPWAAQILGEAAPQTARIDALTDQAMEHLDRIGGAEDRHRDRAFLRFRKILPRLAQAPLVEDLDLEESMLSHFGAFFPRKYDAVGEPQLRLALRHALGAAGRYGLAADYARAVYAALAFLMGSAFDDDPLLSPLADALRGGAAGEQAKVERLVEGALALLDTWLSRG